MLSGLIFNIQKYAVQDGPGIRTTVFLKGCPLGCAWCHNPEGIQPKPELIVAENRCVACGDCLRACPFGESAGGVGGLPARHPDCILCGACVEACATGARQMIGRTLTVREVMDEVLKDRVFYEESGGGVTISGGEPLMQPQFLRALLEAGRAEGLHLALDTTGFGLLDHLLSAAAMADLVLYDLKAFDEELHRRLTGVSNRGILANLKALDQTHANLWIRLPVVPGFNDAPENLARIAEFVAGLRHVTLVNLLPFHRTALHKFRRLGVPHALEGTEAPSTELMERALKTFTGAGLRVQVGG